MIDCSVFAEFIVLGALPLSEKLLWAIGALLQAAVLFRLFRLSLIRVYPAFFAALSVELLQSALMAFLRYGSNSYAISWMITEPLIWISRTTVTLEICRGVLESYRGIWVLGRRSLAGALAISLTLALATMGPEWRFSTDLYPILLGFSLAGKTVLLVLALFLTLLFLFLAWYPIALRPNLIRYAAGFALLLLFHASGLWIRNVQGLAQVRLVNLLLLVFPPLITAFWLLALNRQGEQIALALRQKTGLVEKERLLTQLDQLNRVLAGDRRSA